MEFQDMSKYDTFTVIKPINKGWSDDKKYYIEDIDKNKFLLRLNDIKNYEKKKSKHEAMIEIYKTEIPMSKPIDFGVCNSEKNTYQLLSWIDGEDAETKIMNLTPNEQYQLGVKAGEYLKKMHSIKAPDNIESWESRFNKKIDRNIDGYKNCGIKLENDDKIFNYVNQNRHLLKDRPQTIQHGDYHIGNMLLDNKNQLKIIDFNRLDYGDPWEEFNRIVWCATSSKYFATGRIDGYFDNNIPKKFWDLLALYISSNSLSSIYWSIPFGQKEVNTMINQFKLVLSWYDNMKNTIPTWYQSNKFIL